MVRPEVRLLFPPLPIPSPQSIVDEPIHILNVAIKTDSDIEDDGLAAMFREFTQSKVSWSASRRSSSSFAPDTVSSPSLCPLLSLSLAQQKSLLIEHGIRRLTFLVAQKVGGVRGHVHRQLLTLSSVLSAGRSDETLQHQC